MRCLDCDLRGAVMCITEHFDVPLLPRGSHATERQAWSPRFHASADNNNVIRVLIRSGLWAELTLAENCILNLFVTCADPNTGVAEISYPGLMRYSGINSRTTIAKAVHHFEQLGILRVARKTDPLFYRRVNRYWLTVDDPKFQSLVANACKRQREEIELEKQFRAEEKAARRRKTVLLQSD
jgi:hypothetical protein